MDQTDQTQSRRGVWGAKRHYRDPDSVHRGICGIGYDWPSTVALTDDSEHTTCGLCRFEMHKRGILSDGED